MIKLVGYLFEVEFTADSLCDDVAFLAEVIQYGDIKHFTVSDGKAITTLAVDSDTVVDYFKGRYHVVQD